MSVQETPAERTARHLRHCKRMAELGMALAEAAATRATQAFALPPRMAAVEPGALLPFPGAHPATLFTQLASVVRLAITLECRVAAGEVANQANDSQADPRRSKIRLAIRHATEGLANRAELREEADELLDTELALDPDGTTSLSDLLATICEELDFDLDYEEAEADLVSADLTASLVKQPSRAKQTGKANRPRRAKPTRQPH